MCVCVCDFDSLHITHYKMIDRSDILLTNCTKLVYENGKLKCVCSTRLLQHINYDTNQRLLYVTFL